MLATPLREYVRACFPGIYVETRENPEAIREIRELAAKENWKLATWNCASGLEIDGQQAPDTSDPLAPIVACESIAEDGRTALVVLENFHQFLSDPGLKQHLARAIEAGKQTRVYVVILAPLTSLPIELENWFVVIEHDRPDRAQLETIAREIGTEPGEVPEPVSPLIDAAAGLTRFEAEGAFALSLARSGKIEPQTVFQQKAQILKKSGLLELYRGEERFSDLRGMESLKRFCSRALQPKTGPHKARGVALISPPGCGKSAFAKALGNEIGRPTLALDVGALMGSLVGQTEAQTRTALRIADAMAPCVLFLDEIEKALAGASSSGQTDSGVTARLFGTFLTWMNDHTSDVFVICTSNDISKLPPEFFRAERFDAVFMVDIPDPSVRAQIWELYLEKFGITPNQPRPSDIDWTGAEIRSCCRLSALLDLPLAEAAKNVVPVAVTAADSVKKLREFANGRYLSADYQGIYQIEPKTPAGRRSVARGQN